jgi:hypothetical protein
MAAKSCVKRLGYQTRLAPGWRQPGEEHLIALIRHSDAALEIALEMAGRDQIVFEHAPRARKCLPT